MDSYTNEIITNIVVGDLVKISKNFLDYHCSYNDLKIIYKDTKDMNITKS